MQPRRSPDISPRKKPGQARSTQLVSDILEAAVRVLVRDGGLRFTTVRVADEAGVSVGSLYQYFPNKEALLFRLQTDEWDDTWSLLEDILRDASKPPLDRLRHLVLTYFRSEREEASLRVALDDAGALFRDAPEARKHVAKAQSSVRTFLAEAAPDVPDRELTFAAEFLMTSMNAVAERITQRHPSRAEVDAWARASAEMYVGWLERLRAEHAPKRGAKRAASRRK